MLLLGIDTGGTFTDFVLQTEDGLQTFKLSSTPEDPAVAIMQGLNHFFGQQLPDDLEIIHGSTVATNAFLERKGARTLLITTHGFEDLLFIGRQNRPRLYDFNVSRPLEIISPSQVTGVKERILYDGSVLKPLGKSVGKRVRTLCRRHNIEAAAVCLLHSYANAQHEKTIKSELAGLDIPVTASSEILPEFREYERLTTTVINAYLGPVIASYVKRLTRKLGKIPLQIQQSNGSILPAAEIEQRAVYTILSGPAGGIHGAHQLAQQMDLEKIITFDMGGTSTDVSLCDGKPTLTREHSIDGYPIRIEVMDIHTVGAGGGSLAHIDAGGLLKIGPESAGARPGPVCYGLGGRQLTVTDANLFLGRLLPHRFMGGTMQLHKKKAVFAMQQLAKRLRLDAVETALGMIRIVNANMAKAIRAVSLERGHDPKEFSLFGFGGASGLHCCELARELGVKKIVIPARAGILSAQGMVFAEPTLDAMQALFLRGPDLENQVLAAKMKKLVAKSVTGLKTITGNQKNPDLIITRFLNLRYQGQSYELSIPYEDDFIELFHQNHELNFGYRLEDVPLELVSIQCSVTAKQRRVALPKIPQTEQVMPAPLEEQPLYFEHNPVSTPVYSRADMAAGVKLSGPAVIVDDYTTIVLPESFALVVDDLHNLIITSRKQ